MDGPREGAWFTPGCIKRVVTLFSCMLVSWPGGKERDKECGREWEGERGILGLMLSCAALQAAGHLTPLLGLLALPLSSAKGSPVWQASSDLLCDLTLFSPTRPCLASCL